LRIPVRFRDRIENPPSEYPSYALIVLAVCALGEKACGWTGWILDGVFARTGEKHRSITGDKLLVSDGSQRCPNCGMDVFRTDFYRQLDSSANPVRLPVRGIDYRSSNDVEYY
jgi:hypothetical protein